MLNRIELQGYFGRNPELTEKEGQNGKYKQATFSIAVGRDYGDATDWFYCVVTGKRAEVIDKYFKKGSEILISGRMESYKPKNDPNRTAWLVKVEDFHFTKNGSTNTNGSQAEAPEGFEGLDEDIPF